MKLLNFAHGTIPCRDCHKPMRPTRTHTGGWPTRTVVYGHHGRCTTCADTTTTALAAEDVEQPLVVPDPAPVADPPAVVPETPAPGAEPPAPDPEPLTPAPTPEPPAAPPVPAATPTTMPRRRPRRRFDYHPDVLSICPSCGAEYDLIAGVCRCNRPV